MRASAARCNYQLRWSEVHVVLGDLLLQPSLVYIACSAFVSAIGNIGNGTGARYSVVPAVRQSDKLRFKLSSTLR